MEDLVHMVHSKILGMVWFFLSMFGLLFAQWGCKEGGRSTVDELSAGGGELKSRPSLNGNFGTVPPPSSVHLESTVQLSARLMNPSEQDEKSQLNMTGFSLTADYRISGCASGYFPYGSFTNSSSHVLYRADVGCAVSIDSFEWDGKIFQLQSGVFQTSQGSTNSFVSSQSSSIIAIQVLKQLGSPLSPVGESADFGAYIVDPGTNQGLDGFLIVTPTALLTTIDESDGSNEFRLSIQGTSTLAVDIFYTLTGSAMSILDYEAVSGVVTVPPGASEVSIPIAIVDDAFPELNETIVLNLDRTQAGYFPVNSTPALMIVDNDSSFSTGGLAAHYEPQNQVITSGRISSWTDSSGNGLTASQGSVSLRPSPIAGALNGFAAASFDGSNDILLPTSTSPLLTNSVFTEKTLAFVMRTGPNVTTRQVLYRQGNTTRGLVLYIESGDLYFAGYNTVDDDAGETTPWGVRHVRGPVLADSVYVLRAVFDQPSDEMRLYFNGDLVDSTEGVGLLFSSSGLSFGDTTTSVRFHDSTTGTATAFGGLIYEHLHYNDSLQGSVGLGLDVFLSQKYGLELPLLINISAASSGISEVDGSTVITVSRNHVGTTDLIVPLSIAGSATNGVDYESLPELVTIPAFQTSVSFNLTSIDDLIEDGAEDVIFQVNESADYGLGTKTIVVVGIGDNESFVSPASQFIWYRASVGVTKDASGYVASLSNQISGLHTALQNTQSNKPLYVESAMNGLPAILFDGVNDGLSIANHVQMNTGANYTYRGLALAFRTAADVTSRQLIYEQGRNTRGFNIYIESGSLKFEAWNLSAGTAFGPVTLMGAVSSSSNYFAILEYDAIAGYLTGRLNGVELAAVSGVAALISDNNGIGIGRINSRTAFNGTSTSSGSLFKGHLAEFLYFNAILSFAEIIEMENYFLGLYGL